MSLCGWWSSHQTCEGQTTPRYDPLVVSSRSTATCQQHETLKVTTERIYPAAGLQAGDSAAGTKRIQTEEQKHHRTQRSHHFKRSILWKLCKRPTAVELDLKSRCFCFTSCSTALSTEEQHHHHYHRRHQLRLHHHHDAATADDGDVLHHHHLHHCRQMQHRWAELHPAVLCRCISSTS